MKKLTLLHSKRYLRGVLPYKKTLKLTRHCSESSQTGVMLRLMVLRLCDIVSCFEALGDVRPIKELIKKIPNVCSSEDANFIDKQCNWTIA